VREGFVVCCGRVKPRLAKCERGMSKPQREAEWGYGDIQMWNGTGNHGHINHVEMVSKVSKVLGPSKQDPARGVLFPRRCYCPGTWSRSFSCNARKGPNMCLGAGGGRRSVRSNWMYLYVVSYSIYIQYRRKFAAQRHRPIYYHISLPGLRRPRPDGNP
jgi:hypothetical protein